MTKFIPGKTRIEYGGAVLGFEEIQAAMNVILAHGGRRWTVGPESVALEAELAEKTGVKRSVVTNSGSSALLLALTALHLPKGSKVIIPATTFPTAYNVILQNGLIPLVVDVEYDTFNIKLADVWRALTTHTDTKAIIAVNIAGNPVDVIKLREMAGNTKIILDNCDGYGTLLNGKFIDTYADISCVSFHAAHIITMGEGGAVFTDDEVLADRAKKLREWGRAGGSDDLYEAPGFPKDYRKRYVFEEIGYNIKPLELQCAIGRIQLTKLEEFREKRQEHFTKLKTIFDKFHDFETIAPIENTKPCWMYFPLRVVGVERAVVMDTFEAANIETRTVFSGNILKHPAYKDAPFITVGSLENADDVMKKGMFLSVHPTMVDEMFDYIEEVVKGL